MKLLLLLMLLVLLAIVGRSQSEKIVVTLFLNSLILISSMVFMIMGFNIIFIGWLCFISMSLLTLFYQNGINQKTVSAFISLLIVTILMSVLIWFLCVRSGIYGLNERSWQDEDAVLLNFNININMVRVTYVVLVFGLLGAVKDSAMAVATDTYEVFCNHPDMTFRELFQSGMNIGKDILGVTINTLLFAAIGESILMCQMYFDCAYSLAELVNSKSLFQAAAVVIIGGIGVEISIPITSAVLGFLCTTYHNKPNFWPLNNSGNKKGLE
jgi:uncharacterized membrane protein